MDTPFKDLSRQGRRFRRWRFKGSQVRGDITCRVPRGTSMYLMGRGALVKTYGERQAKAPPRWSTSSRALGLISDPALQGGLTTRKRTRCP
jgi:hypothetical protein